MSPQVKTVAKTAAIGAGVVGVVVVATKIIKSVQHHITRIFPTTDDVLGCASEQPFVASMHQEEQPAVQ